MFRARPYQFESNFAILYTNCYNWGLMTKQQIAEYVKDKLIHPAIYKQITGDDYVEQA